MKKVSAPITRALVAESHPSYYLMHKYWARKPHNVVRAYVEHFTNPGDVVLDPFAGSGVTFIESLLTGRKAVAVDVNPISALITGATASLVDFDAARSAFEVLQRQVQPEAEQLFTTRCTSCGKMACANYFVWSTAYDCPSCHKEVLLGKAEKVGRRYKCPHCSALVHAPSRLVSSERLLEVNYTCTCNNSKPQAKPADADDVRLAETVAFFKNTPAINSERMFRSNRTLIHEGMSLRSFFTARNLYLLATLADAIKAVEDDKLRNLFMFVFTSSVAQASRLIAYRNSLTSGGPAWTVSGFWVPPLHLEMQPWHGFATRFRKIVAGKERLSSETWGLPYVPADSFDALNGEATGLIATRSSTDLSGLLPDDSVDYIWTDPPYGDSVPYLEYCTLWNGWFGLEPDYENEVVISDSLERQKTLDNYQALMHQVFAECHRVLKPGAWLTITFHNKYLPVWEALVTAVLDAGFAFVDSTYQLPAVIPAKSQLSRAGSVTGDIMLNFRRPEAGEAPLPRLQNDDVPALVLAEAERAIAERGGRASTDTITTAVILALLKTGVARISDYDIVAILRRRFVPTNGHWTLQPSDMHLVNQYEQIDNVIGRVVDQCLAQGCLDNKDVLSAVLTEMHGGRTPDVEQVLSIYEERVRASQSTFTPSQMAMLFD